MLESTARVPEPLATDPTDVSDALDVAQSLWENGKRNDAIEWVKRAVESARSVDATRTASLSRAVEEMERALATTRSTPSKPPPVPRVSRPPPVPSKPPPPPTVSRPPPVPPPRAPSIAPPPAAAPAPTKRRPSDHTLRVRASVRVSVRTSVRDDSLFVVRPLADGAAVPPGTREALLTFVADEAPDDGDPS